MNKKIAKAPRDIVRRQVLVRREFKHLGVAKNDIQSKFITKIKDVP